METEEHKRVSMESQLTVLRITCKDLRDMLKAANERTRRLAELIRVADARINNGKWSHEQGREALAKAVEAASEVKS